MNASLKQGLLIIQLHRLIQEHKGKNAINIDEFEE